MTVTSGHAFPSILDPEVGKDPHAHYARLREQAPVYLDPTMGAYLVTTYDAVWDGIPGRAVLHARLPGDPRDHSRANGAVTGGEPARQESGTPHPALPRQGARRAQRRDPPHGRAAGRGDRAAQCGDTDRGSCKEQALDGGAVDIAAQFSQKFPISVIAEMLGLPEDDRPQFIDWYTRLMAFVTNYAADPEVNARGVQAKQELTDYLLPLIAERRKKPGTDLISAIVESEVDGYKMTDDEVRAYAEPAPHRRRGHDGQGLLQPVPQPAAVRGVGARPRRPLPGHPRDRRDAPILATEPDDDPAHRGRDRAWPESGSRPRRSVYLVGASANRDASKYERPDEFRLGREDLVHNRAFSGAANHVSFGMGRRRLTRRRPGGQGPPHGRATARRRSCPAARRH